MFGMAICISLASYTALYAIACKRAHLSGHGDLCIALEAYRTCRTVGVVEDDCNTGFRDTCLAALIDEVLLVLCSHLRLTNERVTLQDAQIYTHRGHVGES